MEETKHVIGGGPRRPEPKERQLLCAEAIRPSVQEGRPGYLLRVCLPSYRSLPLSCIERIEVTIDGQAVDPREMRLILGGYRHRLEELAGLSQIFWWILDYADLFFPWPEPLEEGEHEVAAVMVTVEPYMTGGRFPMYYSSRRRLSVASEDCGGR